MVHNCSFKIYDFPMSLVCCPLTKPGVTLAVVRFLHWDDGDEDTHFFLTLPSVGKLLSTCRHTVGTTHSEILSDAGLVVRKDFRFLYQRLAGAELHRWETYLEHRVQARGWDGHTVLRTLRNLPRSVPQPHRWFLLKVHLNAPITSARLVAAHVIEEPVQCCFCSSSSDSLDHLPRCLTVLDVYNSIRDTANLPPIIDGRHSLMLQERWEGSVLASVLAFFFAIWTVRSMHRRGVHFLSSFELRDLVLVSLPCPWLLRCCPTRSHKQRRQDRVCPPLPTPGVIICRSDGACRGQGIAETLAGWGAAVWSADARGFLGNDFSNKQAEYFALLQCLFRALRLQDFHVIFEVDSLILARQLARHLPWACRSEISLPFINNVYMFVIPFPLFTSRGTFVIFTVNSTRLQIHCPIRRLTSVIRIVLQHFGSVQFAHHDYLS